MVSRSVQENRPRANRSESVDESLGFLAVQRSCKGRVGDIGGGRVGKAISDRGGEDRLESLIFGIVLLILMNLTVILMILMSLTMVLMIILTGKRQENQVENSDSSALAVTCDNT